MALTDFLSSIADAIRSKDFTDAPITATDFPRRILNIPSGESDLEICEISIMENSTSITLPTDKVCENVNFICMIPVNALPFNSNSSVSIGILELFPNGIELGASKVYFALGLANNWGNATKGFNSTTNLCSDSGDGILIEGIVLSKGDYQFIIG